MVKKTRSYSAIILSCLCSFLIACSGTSESTEPIATNTPASVILAAAGEQTSIVEADIGSQPMPESVLEPAISTSHISVIGEDTVVDRAQSTLVRMEYGIYMTFETAGLPSGDAYTIWWVIFNRPENCSAPACGVNDMAMTDEEGNRLYADNGAPLPNLPQREATQFSLLRAVGTVVDVDGTAEFRAHLPVGDAIEAEFGPGLLDPFVAEVHLVARTHGPAIPGAVHDQLNSAWGGCPEGWPKDPCRDTQVSIHNAVQE